MFLTTQELIKKSPILCTLYLLPHSLSSSQVFGQLPDEIWIFIANYQNAKWNKCLDWQDLDEYSWGLLSTQVNPWSLLSKFLCQPHLPNSLVLTVSKRHSSCWRDWHWLIQVLARQSRLSALPHGSGWGMTAPAAHRKWVFVLWGQKITYLPQWSAICMDF